MERNLIAEQDVWLEEQARIQNEAMAKARAAVLALPPNATMEEKSSATRDAIMPAFMAGLMDDSPITRYLRYLPGKKK